MQTIELRHQISQLQEQLKIEKINFREAVKRKDDYETRDLILTKIEELTKNLQVATENKNLK
ncbi:MAG: hypothetical protein ACR2FN_09185 [Chitinophagaceae bacterium]